MTASGTRVRFSVMPDRDARVLDAGVARLESLIAAHAPWLTVRYAF